MTSPTEIRAGDRVTTPDGPGVVRNITRMTTRPGGTFVMSQAVLVELDRDAEHQPLWRAYRADEVETT